MGNPLPVPLEILIVFGGIVFLLSRFRPRVTKRYLTQTNSLRDKTIRERTTVNTVANAVSPLTRFERVRKWTVENRAAVLLCFPLAHLLIIALSYHYWLDHVLLNPNAWIAQAVMITAALLIPGGETPLHHKAGRWILLASIPVLLYVIIWKPVWGRTTSSPVVAVTPPVLPPPATLSPGQDVEVWERVHEKFKNQPDLIAVAERESGFRQWEPNGDGSFDHSRPYLGRENPNDVGVFQINRTANSSLITRNNFNIDNDDGNIDCAEKLYSLYGLGPWRPRGRTSHHLQYSIVVGTEWTNLFKVPTKDEAWVRTDGPRKPILVEINGNTPFVDEPGKKQGMHEDIRTLRFKLVEGDISPTYITMMYDYKD